MAHESLELTCTHGQRLVVYMAAPGTPDYDAPVLLEEAAFAAPDSTSYEPGLSNPRQRPSRHAKLPRSAGKGLVRAAAGVCRARGR